jgi:hypothetical protein
MGTFYDGITMYLDKTKLETLEDWQIVIVIGNELFNLYQGYYYGGTLARENARKIKSISFLCLYHIGLIPNKVWYALSQRGKLPEKYDSKNPGNGYTKLLFEPNKEAAKYLFHDLMINQNSQLGYTNNRIETSEMVFAKVGVRKIIIGEGVMIYGAETPERAREVYYKFNDMRRSRAGSSQAAPIDIARQMANI